MGRDEPARPQWARRAVAVALLAVSLAGLVGCGGSSDGTATDPGPSATVADGATTTMVGQRDQVCGSAAALFFENVAKGAAADDDAGAGAEPGLTVEQVRAFLADVAREADAEAAADVEVVLDGLDAAEGGQDIDDGGLARAAYDRLTVWAAGHCPPTAPIWACTQRRAFTTFGARISDGDESEDDLGGTAETPEAALSASDGAAPGERTAVVEEDDRVVYAWVEEHNLVRKTVAVTLGEDGWAVSRSSDCGDGGTTATETFETVGEAIED